jgi:hypothetical protein
VFGYRPFYAPSLLLEGTRLMLEEFWSWLGRGGKRGRTEMKREHVNWVSFDTDTEMFLLGSVCASYIHTRWPKINWFLKLKVDVACSDFFFNSLFLFVIFPSVTCCFANSDFSAVLFGTLAKGTDASQE